MKRLFALGIIFALTSCTMIDFGNQLQDSHPTPTRQHMELGTFSISLAVKDIAASRTFYEHLGFSAIGGEVDQNWLILRNGEATIGLFQGMFEENIMTFNPLVGRLRASIPKRLPIFARFKGGSRRRGSC